MKKPIKAFIAKLEAMADELRELRESKANPCDDENAEGLCPCHTFDQAIDHIEAAQQTLKCL
jgi:hypothetical protein